MHGRCHHDCIYAGDALRIPNSFTFFFLHYPRRCLSSLMDDKLLFVEIFFSIDASADPDTSIAYLGELQLLSLGQASKCLHPSSLVSNPLLGISTYLQFA